MKRLAFIAFALLAAPAQAFTAMTPNQYVLQEHANLNPAIWEYERPLRAVIHYTDPKPCEGKKNCVEVDATLEGADGKTYNPSGTDGKALVWESNFVYYTSTLQIQCDKPATPFRVEYVHNVTIYGRDPKFGNRYVISRDRYTSYLVRTGKFQKELCRTLIPEGRRNAIDTLNTVACALSPKYCKD